MFNARKRLGSSYDSFPKVRDDIYNLLSGVDAKLSAFGGNISSGKGINIGGGNTINIDIDSLTEESGITNGDFIPFHDTDVGEDRKVDFTDLEANLTIDNMGTGIAANQIVEVIEKYYLQNAQKNGKAEKQEKVSR